MTMWFIYVVSGGSEASLIQVQNGYASAVQSFPYTAINMRFLTVKFRYNLGPDSTSHISTTVHFTDLV